MSSIGALVMATLALILGGCGPVAPSTYRFRMTVEVATPQGIRTGSSVMQIEAYEKLKLTSEEHAAGGAFRGEAVVVDLPNRPLFALLTRCDGCSSLATEVTSALHPEKTQDGVADYVAKVASLGRMPGKRAKLPPSAWPRFVRFDDVKDPRSVEWVNPAAMGVKGITVTTTRDPVTTRIVALLPWLEHLDQYISDPGNPFTSTLPADFGGFRSE